MSGNQPKQPPRHFRSPLVEYPSNKRATCGLTPTAMPITSAGASGLQVRTASGFFRFRRVTSTVRIDECSALSSSTIQSALRLCQGNFAFRNACRNAVGSTPTVRAISAAFVSLAMMSPMLSASIEAFAQVGQRNRPSPQISHDLRSLGKRDVWTIATVQAPRSGLSNQGLTIPHTEREHRQHCHNVPRVLRIRRRRRKEVPGQSLFCRPYRIVAGRGRSRHHQKRRDAGATADCIILMQSPIGRLARCTGS